MRKECMLITGLALGLALSMSAVLPCTFARTAEAHFMTSAEEHEIGAAAAARTEEKYDVVWDDDIVEIQKRLIESNPTRLNWNDGRHRRWLEPMKMYHSDVPNAFMLPGGYSYMADSMVNFMNTYDNDGYVNNRRLRPLNGANIYNTSAVAFVMGHEFGHWAGKDHLESYDKQFGMNLITSILGAMNGSSTAMTAQAIGVNIVDGLWERKMSLSQEMGADEWGLQLIENVPEYSTGGALMKFERFLRLEEIRYPDGKRPKNFRNPHPGTAKRFERARKYIQKSSNGRVEIDDGDLFLDGRHIPLVGRDDVVRRERVYYVAGQIAAAIKKDLFHEKNIMCVSVANMVYAGDPNVTWQVYFIVANEDQTEYKIIDKVNLDERKSVEENRESLSYSGYDIDALREIVQCMKEYDRKKAGRR